MAEPAAPDRHSPPVESLTKRFKVVWRVLLISNLALGAYIFSKKHVDLGKSKLSLKGKENSKTTLETSSDTTFHEKPLLPALILQPAKLREPITEDEQRQLYTWMLEEKRKVKAKNPEEKERIDEEKAILKQHIRAKSIPRI